MAKGTGQSWATGRSRAGKAAGAGQAAHFRGELFMLIAVLLLVVLLWETPIVYPLKILVVLFHELSHAIVGILTGGRVLFIQLSMLQGGLAAIDGGSPFLVAGAGYLGSLLWGGLILLAAQRTKWYGRASIALGVIVLLAALLWVRPVLSFGFFFCLLSAAGLIWLGRRGSEALNHFFLVLTGLTSCLYALLDIKSDILDRPHLHSDAKSLELITGIPALVWGICWLAIGLVAAWFFLKVAAQKDG